MEVLAEIIVFLTQLLFELLLQLVFEVCAELGLEAIKEAVKPSKPPNPALAAFGYFLMGSLLGAVSLVVYPNKFALSHGLQLVNLVVSPVTMGGVMVLMGRWRAHRGQSRLLLHRFWFGLLFALAFALVRFAYAN